MGILVKDLKNIIENHKGSFLAISKGAFTRFGTLEKHLELAERVIAEQGSVDRMEEELGFYSLPQHMLSTVSALKELSDLAREYEIKINGNLLNKIDRDYSIWLPDKSEEHIKTMQYIRDTKEYGHNLLFDLLKKKKSGELYFGNFDEVDYDDLVMMWHQSMLMDSYLQELYSLSSRSTVTTKRRNLFINDHRMAIIGPERKWGHSY